MRFKGLDLNLLIALDILFEEQNVTRAAERMHVGQSAMSSALARMRQHFGDDLLVISGRRLVPTALAESLRQPLREAILRIEAVVDIDREFVPANSTRHFKVEMPDHLVPVVLPLLTRQISTEAPQVLLDVRPPSHDPAPSLHKGELDLVVTPSIYSNTDYVSEPLLINELALLGWSGNPALRQQPDLATVRTLQQVIVRFDRSRLASMLSEEQLDLYGGGNRVALVAPNFSCIAPCLIGTNRIAFMYRQLAELTAQDLPLAIWKVPFPMPLMSEVMMYHPVRRQDSGLTWLRTQLRTAVAKVEA